MKIAPVQNGINTYKIQNFKGLWGETSRIVDRDPVLGVNTDYETYYYYPYMDETQEEILNVVEKNSDAYFDESQGDKYIVKECKVCTTLPFKKVHFDNYNGATASTRITQNLKKVHYSVRDKFVNNTGEQISALNNELRCRLDTKA